VILFFFASRRRHTTSKRDWSSHVCSSDLQGSGHIAFASWMSSLIVSSGISGPLREWCTTLFFTHPNRYNKSLFVLSYHAQPSRRLPLPAAPSLLSTIEPNKNP